MATIIGGIGTSHTPTIGISHDKGKQNDPDWSPLYDGYKPIVQWLAEKKPDVLIVFYNDHGTSFFFDHYPTFAIGLSLEHIVADEGMGPRPLPPVKGHPALARHLAESLVNDEFDISVFQDIPVDHGCFSPLSVIWPERANGWPGAIVPFLVNVIQYPMPTALRCYKLGQAVRRAVESFPADLKVVVVGTGGLSHQMQGERAGFNNTEWDLKFLDLIERDPQALTRMTYADLVRLGGTEGAEIIMWLAMRGALSDGISKLHQNYYLAMTAAWGVSLFEEREAVATDTRTRGISRPADV
ncbi:MAG: gallate dioxygenase [Betaproteobacteria bacterium]|nr:gallate dioxygenase [Betaproteobacteria bacterium]